MAARRSAHAALMQIRLPQLERQARRKATGEMKQLLRALHGDDAGSALAAAKSLAALGPAGLDALPGLALALHHSDPQRRIAAATALGQLGMPALDFVPSLQAAAKESNPDVRAAAAKALEALDSK